MPAFLKHLLRNDQIAELQIGDPAVEEEPRVLRYLTVEFLLDCLLGSLLAFRKMPRVQPSLYRLQEVLQWFFDLWLVLHALQLIRVGRWHLGRFCLLKRPRTVWSYLSEPSVQFIPLIFHILENSQSLLMSLQLILCVSSCSVRCHCPGNFWWRSHGWLWPLVCHFLRRGQPCCLP